MATALGILILGVTLAAAIGLGAFHLWKQGRLTWIKSLPEPPKAPPPAG